MRLRAALRRLVSALGGLAEGPDGARLRHAFDLVSETVERLDRDHGPELRPEALAPGRTTFLVLAKLDRLPALAARVGPALTEALLLSLRDRILESSPTARIGRVGGGAVEFRIEAAGVPCAEAELLRIHALLEQPFDVGSERFALPVVLGAAAIAHGAPVGKAAEQADRAILKAEADGVKCVFFSEQERADASERLALMRDLRGALARAELTLAYQPKLNVKSGRVDAVEGLVRWRHAERGVVPPDQFIGLAEDTGDIGAITRHVLVTALRDQAVLAEAGFTLAMHVNLSGRLVTDEAFCRWVLETCAGAVGEVGLEITETAVIADPARALHNLRAFAEAGVAVAIDDYGSGLSSLAYLKALPARELKIDKSFVLGLSSSHRDPLIVRSTIDLAHALEMEVTAEGVDDPISLALLKVMGCDRVQGYHVAPPLALEALAAFLTQARDRDLTATPSGLLRAG